MCWRVMNVTEHRRIHKQTNEECEAPFFVYIHRTNDTSTGAGRPTCIATCNLPYGGPYEGQIAKLSALQMEPLA